MREPHRLEEWIGADSETAVRWRLGDNCPAKRGILGWIAALIAKALPR